MRTRWLQTLIVLAGVAAAIGMLYLGRWQFAVYQTSGAEASRTRAEAPAVPLADVAPAGRPVTDGFGRRVSLRGEYLPVDQQLLPIAGEPGRSRVLAAMRTREGAVVAVVRGITAAATPPPAPSGAVDRVGVLLPSESVPAGANDTGTSAGAVRLPVLAQSWPGPLLSGFVTLDAAQSTAEGLTPASVPLPEAPGRLRNGGYAAQWIVFAVFAVAMALKMAHDLGRRDLEPAPPVADATSV